MQRKSLWESLALAALAICIIGSELAAPFTKVEESFGMQAVHDILFCGGDGDSCAMDHLSFPGVVPRTFSGSILLAGFSAPFVSVVHDGDDAMIVSHAARIGLGLLFLSSAWFLGNSLNRLALAEEALLSLTPATALYLMLATTFHIVFYATRTLPNTYALILLTFASGFLANDAAVSTEESDQSKMKLTNSFPTSHCRAAVILVSVAATVFRGDVFVFAAALGGTLLLTKRATLWSGCCTGIQTLVVSLLVTVPVDSILWNSVERWDWLSARWWGTNLLWPEGVVLLFNTVQNESHRWGTSPWHWYFTRALPRGLLLYAPLLVASVVLLQRRPKARLYLMNTTAPAIGFITLYSMLPHKEIRFIMIVFPMLLAPSALVMSSHVSSFSKPKWMWLVLGALFTFQVIATVGSVAISSNNYPGASALQVVNSLARQRSAPTTVHLDAFAAMTGVTRFGKLHFDERSRGLLVDYFKDHPAFAHETEPSDNGSHPLMATNTLIAARQAFDLVVARESDNTALSNEQFVSLFPIQERAFKFPTLSTPWFEERPFLRVWEKSSDTT